MRKRRLKWLERLFAGTSLVSLTIIILWLVFQTRFLRGGKGERLLQDWPFTLFFLLFCIAAPLWTTLGPLARLKRRPVRAVLSLLCCGLFIGVGYYGLAIKGLVLGSKVYADRDIYIKSYLSWQPQNFYKYTPDGLLFIRDGEKLLLAGGDIGPYISALKERNKAP